MPQNEHIELHRKRYGQQLDHAERKRKKEAREVHKRSEYAKKALGLKGKMFAKKRHQEKAMMKKTIAMHEEKDSKHKADDGAPQNALPAYLLEREQVRACGGGVATGPARGGVRGLLRMRECSWEGANCVWICLMGVRLPWLGLCWKQPVLPWWQQVIGFGESCQACSCSGYPGNPEW